LFLHEATPVFPEQQYEDDFHKSRRCRNCALGAFCLGFRKMYVGIHGDGEMRPIPDSEAIREHRRRFGMD
jgi:hypothetical protein